MILGNGIAGQRLCERLLRAPEPAPRRVIVLAEESRPAYDRVHLSEALGGRALDDLQLASTDWYRERGIELALGDPAVRLDLHARKVESRSGRVLRFDELVFATGSSAFVPPVPGIDGARVYRYRTADDVRAIEHALRELRGRARVAVLGGGLLGIEVARVLQRRGCDVEVVERAPHLLPRQLDVAAAQVLQRRLGAAGIGLALGRHLETLESTSAGVRMHATGVEPQAFDLVVVAAGVRARDELAREAGLACHPRGGIFVDERLRTSVPGVYAIGECARHEGVVYGLAAPCLGMADALAETLRGNARRFRAIATATRLKLDCVDVSVAGDTHQEGHAYTRATYTQGDLHRCLVTYQGRVVGGVAVGDWPEWPRVQDAIARRRLLLPSQRRRLAKQGIAWRGESPPIARWSDATTVCTCMGVDCGALRAALADGCTTAAELSRRTGAASACGTCRPLLEALAGERGEAVREPAGGGLLPAGIAAAALVALLCLAPPIAFANSVQDRGLAGLALDVLWRNDLARQITGFTTLALCLASLVFSLRKRWRRLARFSFQRWRGAHALLGVGALLLLGAHSGFRLGSHLDRALAVSFLALAALGALAGATTALEARLSPRAGAQLRRAFGALHALSFWPFPVLVFFHALKTYWY